MFTLLRSSSIPGCSGAAPLASAVQFLLVLTMAGCGAAPDERPASQSHPLAGISLKIAVVGDSSLATAVGQLRGEWTVQTGADFQVVPVSESKLTESLSQPPGNSTHSRQPTEKGSWPFYADAVIGPAYLVGAAADQGRIVPLSEAQLRNTSGNWSDIFDLLRLHELAWGGKTWAVPFGSPVLVCYCRADLLEKLGRDPPQTWGEYLELARLLADRKILGPETATKGKSAAWSGTAEPLDSGWAGLVLLAHAASYAKHPDNYSTLFHIDTMEPLVAGPPFVKALEDIVAAARLGPADALDFDPDAARTAFWQGRCAMALSWPTATAAISQASTAKGFRIVFSELPHAERVYNVGNQKWETPGEDQDPHVPLLGIAGRVGAVCSASLHRDAALELIAWLSAAANGEPVGAASPATTLYRHAQLKGAKNWVEKPVSPAAASQYAALTEATFRRPQWLSALRIPGRDEYLAALDHAVRQAVQSKQSPAAALREAAAKWHEITDRLGREAQRVAYRRSLELEP
jgi:multiple sugar transport system substrate-binding protein